MYHSFLIHSLNYIFINIKYTRAKYKSIFWAPCTKKEYTKTKISFIFVQYPQNKLSHYFLQWNSHGIWLTFKSPSNSGNVLFNWNIKEHIRWEWDKNKFFTYISKPICCLLYSMLVNQFWQLIEMNRNQEFWRSMKTRTHVPLRCSLIICQISPAHTAFCRLEIKHDEFIHT